MKPAHFPRRARAFTLLEVCLVLAIIGMMLFMIVGYLATKWYPSPQPGMATPAPAAARAPVTPIPLNIPFNQ